MRESSHSGHRTASNEPSSPARDKDPKTDQGHANTACPIEQLLRDGGIHFKRSVIADLLAKSTEFADTGTLLGIEEASKPAQRSHRKLISLEMNPFHSTHLIHHPIARLWIPPVRCARLGAHLLDHAIAEVVPRDFILDFQREDPCGLLLAHCHKCTR